jgi:hypothetical protein
MLRLGKFGRVAEAISSVYSNQEYGTAGAVSLHTLFHFFFDYWAGRSYPKSGFAGNKDATIMITFGV